MSDIKYVTTPDFILREIGDEAVLVPIGDVGELENSIITLNDTYAFIWRQFNESRTMPEVIEAAHREYDDPEGIMERQITEASDELIKRGILKAVNE